MRLRFRLNFSAFSRFVDRAAAALDIRQPGPVRDGTLAAADDHGEALRQRYASASSGDGTWAPLAESTIKARQAKSEVPIETLFITGSLESSMQRDDPNHYLETTDNSVIEGTTHRLARFHQDGTDHMPARTLVVEPTAETLDAMKASHVNGLREAIEGAIK